MSAIICDRIPAVVKSELTTWAIYGPGDRIRVVVKPGLVFIEHESKLTWWYANIIESVFYLLHIELAKAQRGKGHGNALYVIIEQIAEKLECQSIRQTPSGSTPTGESRESYLCRRGWIKDGLEVFKEFERSAGDTKQ